LLNGRILPFSAGKTSSALSAVTTVAPLSDGEAAELGAIFTPTGMGWLRLLFLIHTLLLMVALAILYKRWFLLFLQKMFLKPPKPPKLMIQLLQPHTHRTLEAMFKVIQKYVVPNHGNFYACCDAGDALSHNTKRHLLKFAC